MTINWIKVAAVNMAVAIGLGAFGAHGLKHIATEHALQIWQTATLYMLVNAIGLLCLGILQAKAYAIYKSAACIQAGILLFCGSLYGMALGLPKWFGIITPMGGLLFMIGWLILAFSKITPNN